MICELKASRNTLTEEQKIQVEVHSLLDLWETMVINMINNKNIKTYDDLSRHLELEAKHLEASKTTKASKSERAYVANNDSCVPKGPKRKNYTPRQYSGNGPAPKKAKNTKHKWGKWWQAQ